MEARESALGAGGPAAPPTSCAGAPPESASPAASMVATESSSGPGATSACAQPQLQQMRPAAEVPFPHAGASNCEQRVSITRGIARRGEQRMETGGNGCSGWKRMQRMETDEG